MKERDLIKRAYDFISNMPVLSDEQVKLKDDLFLSLQDGKEVKEDKPVLIGYLAVKMGYGGHKPMEVGTPIYSHRGLYLIDHIRESDGKVDTVKYHAESFSPDKINFIVRE